MTLGLEDGRKNSTTLRFLRFLIIASRIDQTNSEEDFLLYVLYQLENT